MIRMCHGAHVTPQTYAITFKGEAGTTVRAAFEDLDISTEAGFTTLRGKLPDQAALHGVIDRMRALGLELIDVRLTEDEPEDLDRPRWEA